MLIADRLHHCRIDARAVGHQRAERVAERASVRVAHVDVARHGAVRDLRKLGRHPGCEVLQERDIGRDDAHHQFAQRVRIRKRQAPRQKLVHHDAERPHIAASIDARRALGLFRRHVQGSAEHRPSPRQAVGGLRELFHHDLGHPEVEDLEDELARVALGQKQVCRLDVTMDDPGLVRLGQAHCGLQHELGRDQRIERPHATQRALQILAGEHLHDHVRVARLGVGTGVEDLDHVIALDHAAGLRLAEEALDDLLVLTKLGRQQQLDRAALERDQVPPLVDRAHPAGAEQAHQLVFSGNGLAFHAACGGASGSLGAVRRHVASPAAESSAASAGSVRSCERSPRSTPAARSPSPDRSCGWRVQPTSHIALAHPSRPRVRSIQFVSGQHRERKGTRREGHEWPSGSERASDCPARTGGARPWGGPAPRRGRKAPRSDEGGQPGRPTRKSVQALSHGAPRQCDRTCDASCCREATATISQQCCPEDGPVFPSKTRPGGWVDEAVSQTID